MNVQEADLPSRGFYFNRAVRAVETDITSRRDELCAAGDLPHIDISAGGRDIRFAAHIADLDVAAAFQECLNLVRKISDAHPRDEAAQRELWRTMWHVASVQGAGGHWNQVVAAMEKMQAGGVLDPEGRRFLEEGRRRVPA